MSGCLTPALLLAPLCLAAIVDVGASQVQLQSLHQRTAVEIVEPQQQQHNTNDENAKLLSSGGVDANNISETDILPAAEVLQGVPEDRHGRGNNLEGKQAGANQKRRGKRSIDNQRMHFCEKSLSLMAFGQNLSLCLRHRHFSEDPTFRSFYPALNVTIYGSGAQKSAAPLTELDLTFVVGHVEGEQRSAVDGFVARESGLFFGSVYVGRDILFVDPDRHGNQTFTRYNDPDDPDGRAAPSRMAAHQVWPKYRMVLPRRVRGRMRMRRPRRSAGEKHGRRVCDVAVVVDHLLFKEVGRSDVVDTLLQVFWILKEANAVLASKDLDGDGRSERLSVSLSAVTILSESDSDINILDAPRYPTPEDFLKEFSRYNFSSYCLGLLFTNRVFDDLVLGLSWRGNPVPGGVGGICQTLASFNALFVSTQSGQQPRIPLRMSVLNLVHELMHSFGAKHDPPAAEDANCTPNDVATNGRYLMSRFSNNGRRTNHHILSPCTMSSVLDVMAAPHRTKCLREVKGPFCGDGVRDIEEGCDCGTTQDCLAKNSTCTPSQGGYGGEPGCTISGTARIPAQSKAQQKSKAKAWGSDQYANRNTKSLEELAKKLENMIKKEPKEH